MARSAASARKPKTRRQAEAEADPAQEQEQEAVEKQQQKTPAKSARKTRRSAAAASSEEVEATPAKNVRKTPARSAKKAAKGAQNDADQIEEDAPVTKKAKPSKAAAKTPAKTPAKKGGKKAVAEEAAAEEVVEVPKSGTKRPRKAVEAEEEEETKSDVKTGPAKSDEPESKHRRLLSYADEVEDRDTAKPITRSLPAGGRWWKKIQNEKTSMIVYKANPKTLSTSWERKMEIRRKREALKAFEAEQKAKHDEHVAQMREKRLEKRRRAAENEFQHGAYQTINADKIKRMSKKQLRNIAKTQMDNDGVVRAVPVYGTGPKLTKAAKRYRK